MSQYTITVNKKNVLPPSVVGDGAYTIDYGVTLVFTRAMLTTMTVPPYSHPDGNPAYQLLVLSLPSNGELQYDGNPVNINDTILFTDIDNGLFTFVPNNATENDYIVNFEFKIADNGSYEFVG